MPDITIYNSIVMIRPIVTSIISKKKILKKGSINVQEK